MEIKTQFLKQRSLWTAFITHNGYDFQEYGETEANAIYFLKKRHPQLKEYEKGKA